MKKLILFSIMCILLLTLVSGFEFDNTLTYENNDMKVLFENAYGWPLIGSELGTIELKSHSSVTEVKQFGYGKEEVVMYYDFEGWELYKNGLGEVIFTDERTGKEIDKDYYFVEWKEIDVPAYVKQCEMNYANETSVEVCGMIEKGTKKEFQWVKYNSKDIPNRNIRIGLKTYVGRNDYIDGVWTIAGKKVSKHITWSGDLDTDLLSYYPLNESSGNAQDIVGSFNLTNIGTMPYVAGLIGNSANASQIKYLITSSNTDIATIGTSSFSASFWINVVSPVTVGPFFVGQAVSWGDVTGWGLVLQTSGEITLTVSSVSDVTSGVDVLDTGWNHIIVSRTGTTTTLYVNNVSEIVLGSSGSSITQSTLVLGGATVLPGRVFNGGFDEFGIWNRTLTQTERDFLYNNGAGCAKDDDTCVGGGFPPPVVTLNKPDNNTVFQTTTISMNCTVFDGIGLVNVSLILDGVVNETNSSGINNSLYNFDKTLSGGIHSWTCRAANSNSLFTTADIRLFRINISVETELISPVNNQNFTTSIVNLVFNSTPFNQDLVFGNTTIWHSNGTLLLINSTSLSGSIEVQTNITNGLSDGVYLWTADTAGTVNTNTTSNRTFTVHTTPSSVVINFPKGNIESFSIGDSLDLNWTISEPGQNLSEHITNCSFTYNTVEIFFNLTQCIEINSTTFLYVNGVNNLSFKVQEEFNLNTTNTTSWTFSVLEINQTFNNETIEGSLEDFEAQIKLGSTLSISASALIYNGTTNVGSSSTSGGITTLTATNVLISSVTANTNLSFVWALILSDSSQINLTIKNQTVLNLDLDNCGVFTNRIFNFTSVDEEKQTILVNTTQEIAVNIFSSDRSELILNLSDEYTSNPTLICLNINLTNSTIYSVDVIARYSAEDPDYAIEYFNIVNLELTNDTEEQVVTLFDLNLSDSTEFQLTFTGQDFLPVENALVFIERQYIAENTFKTVELPKTDSNGQTVLHLVRNDVLYNIIVVKDNVVLGSFSNLIAFCDDFTIGDCKISLNAIGEETGVFNYDEGVGILYDTQPVYNASTFLVSFDFISSDGESKIVTLTVERRDVFGNTSICSSTVISVGGTVFCNTGNVTDATLFTSIFVDEEEWINSQVSVDTSTYGSMGYVALFFISLLLILTFGDSKNGTIFSLLIGYLIAITMGWMVGGIIGPTSSGVWIIVLTIVAIYQINKNRVT